MKVARWQGRDSRLESSSDGEIFDKEKKEEDVKTEEEEKDQAVKNFCEIKLKKVTNNCGLSWKNLSR